MEVHFTAIFHLEAEIITREEGRSVVAASAYRSGSEMTNEYDGVVHSYTRKRGVVYEEVMLPENAPVEWQDREKLWNAVELAEKAKDSRLAREFNAALPVELTLEEWIPMLQEFIQKNFVDLGMAADFAIHNVDPNNPHVHIMLTLRPLDEKGKWQAKTQKEYLCVKDSVEHGFTAEEYKTAQNEGWEKQYQYKIGKKKVYMTPSEAEKQGVSKERVSKYPKSTRYGRQNPITEQWNSEEQLKLWRKAWETTVNEALEKANRPERVDCRSFKDRGIDEIPTIHEGTAARMIEKKGGISERCEINRQIRAENSELRRLKAHMNRIADAVKSAVKETAQKLPSVSEIASGLERLRFNLIRMTYYTLYNSEMVSRQRNLLSQMEDLRTAYDLNRKKSQQIFAWRKKLIAERDKLSPIQVFQRKELTEQINALTAKLQECSEDEREILRDMDCKSYKDIPEFDKRIEKVKENIALGNDNNNKFYEKIHDESQQFRKEKADIPTELLGEVRQERSYLRQEHCYDLLHELQNDRKHYAYERYERAEQSVNKSLRDDVIVPEKRPEVIKQEQQKAEEQHKRHKRKDIGL